MAFAIIMDSASNLNNELLKKYNIEMISFHYELDNQLIPSYDPNRDFDVDAKKFYDEIKNGKFIKTSLISPSDYIESFRKHLQNGEDVLSISISGKLSGTYNSACNARDMLLEEFPDRKIICLDSLGAGFGEGLLGIYASGFRKTGFTIDETEKKLNSLLMNIREEFIVDKLIYLKRTGRISTLVYSIGKILDIKPILRASRQGTIESGGKVRGRKKSLLALLKSIKENIINPEEQVIYVSHCDALEEANYLADQIKKELPVKDTYVHMHDMCTGAHLGPGAIAIFYYGKERS